MTVPGDVLQIREVSEPDAGPETNLVGLLEAQAVADQISGAELARRIGVDQAVWSRVWRGHGRFSPDTCAKIVTRWPHMRAAAAHYLRALYQPETLSLLEEAGRLLRSSERRAS